MIRNLIAATALLALGASAAAAPDQERPRLKGEVTVTGNIVHIGDLIENAGIVAKVPIFRAPDLGSTGSVPADVVVEAVRAYALVGLDTGDVSEVVVTRASRTIPAKDIEDRIAQALSAQYALGPSKDIVVTFDRELRSVQVETRHAAAIRPRGRDGGGRDLDPSGRARRNSQERRCADRAPPARRDRPRHRQ
jgi:flagella basal body P-ring formation protein FlgA